MGVNHVDVETLADMITVYDAADDLFELCQRLTGDTLETDTIVYDLLLISEVIKRFSPLYDSSVDWDQSAVAQILNNRVLPVRQRAAMLLADKDQA